LTSFVYRRNYENEEKVELIHSEKGGCNLQGNFLSRC